MKILKNTLIVSSYVLLVALFSEADTLSAE